MNYSHTTRNIVNTLGGAGGGGGGGSTIPSIVTDGSAPCFTWNGKNVYCKEFIIPNLPNSSSLTYATDIKVDDYKIIEFTAHCVNSDGSYDDNVVPLLYPSLSSGGASAIRIYTNETTDRIENVVQIVITCDSDRSTRKGVVRLFYVER